MATSPESKRERRLAARAERQRLAEEGRRKARQRRRVTIFGLALLAVAALAGAGYFISQSALNKPALGRTVPDEGRNHTAAGDPLTFQSNPPASGTHYPTWTRPGFYTEPQDKGNWVHSLEHGYVVVLYNCPTACPEITQPLRQFYETAPKSSRYGYQKLVVAPYREMDHRIAAIAWNHILELDELDLDQVMAFYRAYMDKGPEDAG